jgi:predicted AAA+ superfamily ATPase
MQRKILVSLETWKMSPYRKPLLLEGARQVGKTWALLEFGHSSYENVVYLNFEANPLLGKTFDENLEPAYLIPLLSRIAGQTIIPEKTLIILDEIQLCERALTSLKYFCEMAPAFHIAAAGSLLGVAVNRGRFSFPVGKVDIKTMYPMDMEDFLLACGEANLISHIRNCFRDNSPMPAVLHEAAFTRYRQYLLTGGMPEAISKYLETQDFNILRNAQAMILDSYLKDMGKYNNQADIRKVRLVYDNVTVQLSRKNTQFRYKLIKSGARASEFENAIEWLCLAGIIKRIYRVENPQKPLENYRDIDSFKVYVSDPGLLCAKKGIFPNDILYPAGELDDFKGGMTENYVCSQLTALGLPVYYWTSSREAEVDFIIQREGDIIPIEVKSADNKKAKSLDVYMESYKPGYAIKLGGGNFGFAGGKKTVPLYAAFCL